METRLVAAAKPLALAKAVHLPAQGGPAPAPEKGQEMQAVGQVQPAEFLVETGAMANLDDKCEQRDAWP